MPDFARLYVDCAPLCDPYVQAAYTPYGIQMLDSRFGHAIRAAATLEECAQIALKLADNPHLHPEIKENLMFNLGNAARSIQAGHGPAVHVCGPSCYTEKKYVYGTYTEKVCQRKHFDEL